MTGNYYTLRAVVSRLQPAVTGKMIRTIFTQERDQLALEIADLPGCLILSCAPRVNAMYHHDSFARARRNSVEVLREAHGRTILGLELHPDDRIVTIRIEDRRRLEARFFGPGANVFLLDEEGTILGSFKKPRTGSDTKASGTEISPTPDRDTAALVHQHIEFSDSLSGLVRKVCPRFGRPLVDEVVLRAGLHGDDAPHAEVVPSLVKAIDGLLADLSDPRPRIYFSDESGSAAQVFSIVPLSQYRGMQEQLFADVNEAIRFFLARTSAGKSISRNRDPLGEKLQTMLSRTKRSLQALERDLEKAERGDDYERFGTLLLGNLATVRKGSDHMAITVDGEVVDIPLAPHLTPSRNAQKYFDKAKRARAARATAESRLRQMRDKISTLERLAADLVAVTTKASMGEFMNGHAGDLEALGLGPAAARAEQLPFRMFVVDGGFEVWAGKNSESNDRLTMKHSKPADLWFHARGSGGSHVVLRVNTGKGKPGKKAIHQAASIAAYFSQMKSSRLVPVAMTERKYVRKPRGAPAGTVAITREEVLLVEPGLPAAQTQG